MESVIREIGFQLYYRIPLPVILLAVAGAVFLRGLCARGTVGHAVFGRRMISAPVARWLNRLLAVAWVAFVLWYTVFRREMKSAQVLEWRPFVLLTQVRGHSDFYEVYRGYAMNALLFVPLGLLLPFCGRGRSAWRPVVWAVLIALAVSCGVEALQYRFVAGRAETDDVIFNTFGAFVGSLSYFVYYGCPK